MKELRDTTHRRYLSSGKKPLVDHEMCNRAFTDNELRSFLSVVHNKEDKACFVLMATLGLRENEVIRLRGRDLQGGSITVPASKGGCAGVYKLPPGVLESIPVCGPKERIFMATNLWGKPRASNKAAIHALARRFRAYCNEAGLDDIYLHTKPCGKAGTENPRFRLSLHSFRRYAIRRFLLSSGSLILASKFARHRNVVTTLQYLKGFMPQSEVNRYMDGMSALERPAPQEQTMTIPRVAFMP